MAARALVKYFVVDAFAKSPFKGNQAAVCLLDEEREEKWLQAVAGEFNLPITCYLTRVEGSMAATNPAFHIHWFYPSLETKLCGHGTIASAHVLFSTGMVEGNKVEFVTESGAFVAERILNKQDDLLIQLHFPLFTPIQLDPFEIELVPKSLKGSHTKNIVKKAHENDLIVEFSSSKVVAEFQPSFDDMKRWPGRVVAITGIAPFGSDFDFFTRVFIPNGGVNEDQVCGSIHCALAPYWSQKLGKSDLKAYMASQRGGVLELQVEQEAQKVLIAGKAITVMEGSLFA